MLPEDLVPKTLFFKYPVSPETILDRMIKNNLHFPVIMKPDYGERGWMVEKIEDSNELKTYVNRIRINFILQEYIQFPLELGIFFYRYPGQTAGIVSSIVKKELLSVTGNGMSNIRELIRKNQRAFLQLEKIENHHPDLMNWIPGKGENVELDSVGNHSRGATFLNGNHLITDELVKNFNEIAEHIDGFNYGRFDIRCPSLRDLYAGKNIMILELNGAKSEPAHIYEPGFPLFKAYRVLFKHWKILFKIATQNHRNGIKYPSFREGWAVWRKFKKYKRLQKRNKPDS